MTLSRPNPTLIMIVLSPFGGGIDFMGIFVEETFGVVPENLIGSFAANTFEQVDGQWHVVVPQKIEGGISW